MNQLNFKHSTALSQIYTALSRVKALEGTGERASAFGSPAIMKAFEGISERASAFGSPAMMKAFEGISERASAFGSPAMMKAFEGISERASAFGSPAMMKALEGISERTCAFGSPAMMKALEGFRAQTSVFDSPAMMRAMEGIRDRYADFEEETGDSQVPEVPDFLDVQNYEPEVLDSPAGAEVMRVCAPSLLCLRRLFAKGIDFGKIKWRDLEEIVGELLTHDGYHVQVGRGTKDGGVDVLAWKEIERIGLLRTVWQAKHLKEGNKVELSTIRELADIRNQSNATKGYIVTTGFLTKGALERITQETYHLGKIDGPELKDWIKHTLYPSGR